MSKVEVQEALPPAGVIGAEPLTLVPQHLLPPQTSVALFAGAGGQLVFFRQADPMRPVIAGDLNARSFFSWAAKKRLSRNPLFLSILNLIKEVFT